MAVNAKPLGALRFADIDEECCGGRQCTAAPSGCLPRCGQVVTPFLRDCGQLLFGTDRPDFLALLQQIVVLCSH